MDVVHLIQTFVHAFQHLLIKSFFKSLFKLKINDNCSPLSALEHSYFHSVVKAQPMTSLHHSRMQIVHSFPFCCQVEFPICHSGALSFHYKTRKKEI